MRRKKERSKQGQTNNKAKKHSTPKAVTFPNKNELHRHIHVHVHVVSSNENTIYMYMYNALQLTCIYIIIMYCLHIIGVLESNPSPSPTTRRAVLPSDATDRDPPPFTVLLPLRPGLPRHTLGQLQHCGELCRSHFSPHLLLRLHELQGGEQLCTCMYCTAVLVACAMYMF